jgi:hypothetical protein
MWKTTLFIWTTDNGSPVQVAGSNAPLRGGKGSDWEGGVRTPAFISGGVLPPKMAGISLPGIVAVWDWFATFTVLAGVDPKDPNPLAPADVDSYNMWPYFSGAVSTSPRTEIVFDHLMFPSDPAYPIPSACTYAGLIQVGPCDGGGAIRVCGARFPTEIYTRGCHWSHACSLQAFLSEVHSSYRFALQIAPKH